ncbi:PD-(D/E)XK nuclease family protein [Nonomuraea sp. NPDC049141]|uniref:RecB family exonuclease n=1 Tax=Nonomuraea sp. NPDC049141 TaxID=3155500 RepID=UPI0033C0DC67
MAYKLERIDRVDPLPAAWSFQGTAVHAAAEAYERSMRTMSIRKAQDVFEAVWLDKIDEAKERQPNLNMWLRGGRKTTERDIAERFEAGLTQVADYIDFTTTEPFILWVLPDGSPATEVGFRTTIAGVLMVGYIDLVLEDPWTGEIRIRDLKTGAKPSHTPVQLAIYGRAVQRVFGIKARYGDYYMARDAAPTKRVDLTRFSDELLGTWIRGVDVMESAAYEAGAYPPSPSEDHCWSCAVKHHCPVPALKN